MCVCVCVCVCNVYVTVCMRCTGSTVIMLQAMMDSKSTGQRKMRGLQSRPYQNKIKPKKPVGAC